MYLLNIDFKLYYAFFIHAFCMINKIFFNIPRLIKDYISGGISC